MLTLLLLTVPPTQAETVFTVVTDAVGLSGYTNPTPDSNGYGGGVAVLDFDGDGWFDLMLARKAEPLVLLRNEGGTFTDVTAGSGLEAMTGPWVGVQAADIDGDGHQDLLLTGDIGGLLALGDGAGGFSAVSGTGLDVPGLPAHSAALADLDADGDLDIYMSVHSADLTLFEDGHPNPDALPPGTCDANNLYFQSESLVFTERAAALGVDSPGCTMAVAASDLDGDGFLDLYANNEWGQQFSPDALFWGAAGPSYAADEVHRPAITGMGIAVADYDRDGQLDFFLSNTGGNLLMRNLGGRSFVDMSLASGLTPITGESAWGAALEDFDLDGWPDLWVVNSIYPNRYWRNDGGTFTELREALPLDQENTTAQLALVTADFDNDGDLDVVTGGVGWPAAAAEEDSWVYWRNDQDEGRRWLQVHLQGPPGNTDAFGARVVVEAGGLSQLAEVTGGTSYAGSSWRLRSFGLGDAEAADITVTWPDGSVTTALDVSADQRLSIAWTGAVDTGVDTDTPDTGADSGVDSDSGADDGGEDTDTPGLDSDSADDTGDPREGSKSCGCAASPAGGLVAVWLLPLIGLRRRSGKTNDRSISGR